MARGGVSIGPMARDPEEVAGLGQIGSAVSAREAIRLHRQMYPPELRRQLGRVRDAERMAAVVEHLDEVAEYVRTLVREDGSPLVPDDGGSQDARMR